MARLEPVEPAAPAGFQQALERQVHLTTPIPVRDVEAMLKRD